MSIHTSLYMGQQVCLGPIDPEKDAAIESRWTHDPEYLQMLGAEVAFPLSQARLKKHYEALEKAMDERKNFFYFAIRHASDDRLLGFASLDHISWSHDTGWLKLGIGSPEDRRKGYGRETVELLLRFAFSELNLHCLNARCPGYNLPALALLAKAGFVEEVRRRQALQRNGQVWDLIDLGLLRSEWAAARPQEGEQS